MTVRTTLHAIGDRICVLPFPVLAELAVPRGAIVILRIPTGIASTTSLVMIGDGGSVQWVAEPCAWPPDHDPYVEAWLDDGELFARSASGWTIRIDQATGAGTLQVVGQ